MPTSALTRRTALRRPGPPTRRKGLRPVSRKRKALAVERREFVIEVLASRPRCEVRASGCTGRSVDVHETLTRARGGAIVPSQGLTETDVLAVCRSCHTYLDEHQDEAHRKGWLRHSWER